MNFTKSKSLLLAAAVVTALNFSSCSKYEEGPAFSLRTKTARLTGEWEIVKMTINGQTESFNNEELVLEFDKDNNFEMTFSYYGYSGTEKGEWEWIDNKEAVEVTMDGEANEWEISKLTNDEFWFEDEDGSEYEAEKLD
ncbi:MAG: lipocalin family protein [Bacteroidota bacterium]